MSKQDASPPMHTHVFPGPMPAFTCAVDIPDDWQPVTLPPEQIDFSEPQNFLPVGVAMAKYAAIVFTVAVRPKFEDGAVTQWLDFLAKKLGYEPINPAVDKVGDIDVAVCMAVQESDAGKILMRIHMFEDGGYLYNVGVLAPAPLFESLVPTFQRMLASFKLANRLGATAPLTPESGTASAGNVGVDNVGASNNDNESSGAGAPPDASAPSPNTDEFAALSLADDAASLDPEHPMNRVFRDNGRGLVPRVLEVSAERRRAVVGAGSIQATFHVPLGWHVVDDGRRVLIFDRENKIQVNINLFDAEGSDDDAVLGEVLAGATKRYPDLQHIRLELMGMKCLALRGVVEDGQTLEQAYLVRRSGPGGLALMTRVTSIPDDMTRAVNLAGAVLGSLTFPG